MICKNCGKENADGLTFCQNCGKRLDGKKICPACGAKIDEEAKFCGVCGANTESINSEIAAAQTVAAKEYNTFSETKAQSLIDLTGLILVCLAAFAGLLFTFLIGIKATGSLQTQSYTVYSYFREAYEDLEGVIYHNNYQKIISYMPNIVGTIVSAAAILGTVTFAILTAVSAVKKIINNRKNTKLATFATITYVWYAVSAMLFLALHAVSANVSVAAVDVSFTEATIAGLILGGIALFGYYFCRIISNLQRNNNKKFLTLSLVAFISAVLIIVIAVLSVLPVATFEYLDTVTSKMSTGYFMLSTLSLILYDPQTQIYRVGDPTITASCLAGFLSQAIMVIMAAIAFVMLANAVCGDGKAKILPVFTACSFAFSISNLVCAIVAATKFDEIIPKTSIYSYAVPIAILVLNALALAGSIVYKILSYKQEKKI